MKKGVIPVAMAGLAALAFLAALYAGRSGPESPEDTGFLWDGLYLGKQMFVEVPYVSTPLSVVHEMIRLADVKADDVVYDLGCGDGRLVIEAVKRTGCRGVGVDIDGELIAVCRAQAKAAGVSDRVRFETQDFFETDIREATVMLIYLFTHINVKLRPKFLNEMRPGSRLVSHAFDMGDWKPDHSTRVGSRQVFYWVIPAPVAGTWALSEQGDRPRVSTLLLEQQFQQIGGTLSRAGRWEALADAKLAGEQISFVLPASDNGKRPRREFAGVVRGDTITGTVVTRQDSRVQNSRWKAVRYPRTKRPIEAGFPQTDPETRDGAGG